MFRSWMRVASLTAAAVVTVSVVTLRGADEPVPTLLDGFESPKTVWQQEQTDATVNLLAHERSNRAAHEGQSSERFQFVAGLGSTFFYSYALPKVPVTDNLKVGLYVRSNRGGVRLYGRVVLPADTDPDTGEPSFVLVPGTIYDNVDRWQRLELIHMLPSIERQARVLRASTRRPVSLEGAYLERLVVNLFGGEGDSEAFLDELTVTPVPPEAVERGPAPRRAGPRRPRRHGRQGRSRAPPPLGSSSRATGSGSGARTGRNMTGSSRQSMRRGPTSPSSAGPGSTSSPRASTPTRNGSGRPWRAACC